MEPGNNNLPRPYLSREETNERLERLGFLFHGPHRDEEGNDLYGTLVDTPEDRKRFRALQELIAGAIAEWADVKDDMGEEGIPGLPLEEGDINAELLEWAEEWLVG